MAVTGLAAITSLSATEPGIQITIGGRVSGINLKECKDCAVVIFSRTDKWYVQPTVASPYTMISEDLSWETDIHLGYEYAALLVKPSYRPPPTTAALPKVGGDVLALTRATPKKQ
jgi:hypothetical protein